MKCASPECRENLKQCINKKMNIKSLITCLSIIVIISCGISTLVYNSYAQRQQTQSEGIKANTDSTRKIEKDIGKIQTDVEWIKKEMIESAVFRAEILRKLESIRDNMIFNTSKGENK